MNLVLKAAERRELMKTQRVIIKRVCHIPAPKSSIVHGTGNKFMFDKIAYIQIYGDTDDYIEKMKREGVRGTEYIHGKTGDRNINNGSRWYAFNRVIDEFGEIGKVFTFTSPEKKR